MPEPKPEPCWRDAISKEVPTPVRAMNDRGNRVLFLLAVICTVICAYGCYRYSLEATNFAQWRAKRSGVTEVDFSKPGEYRIALPMGATVAPHGYLVYLDPENGEPPSPLPRGEIQIEDEGPTPIVFSLSGALRPDQKDINGYLVGWARGSSKLEKVVTIQVVEGSQAWSGVKAVVFAKYWICGLEAIPILLWASFAGVVGVIALIFWGALAWSWVSLRRRASATLEVNATT